MDYLEIALKVAKEQEARRAQDSAAFADAESHLPAPDLSAVAEHALDLPSGVRLIRYEPKAAPLAITECSVVIDVPGFIRSTFEQLEFAMKGKEWLAGNRTVAELIHRLQQAGIHVEVNT